MPNEDSTRLSSDEPKSNDDLGVSPLPDASPTMGHVTECIPALNTTANVFSIHVAHDVTLPHATTQYQTVSSNGEASAFTEGSSNGTTDMVAEVS